MEINVAVIQSLGEQIKVRQQVIATSTIYFKRFYARYVLWGQFVVIKTSLEIASCYNIDTMLFSSPVLHWLFSYPC